MFLIVFYRILQLRMRKKIVMLIRIRHTCVAYVHKKTVLSLETSSEINFEFIKFSKKKGKCLPLTKTNREHYINITFPDWVIVKNIPRNVIITFQEMIFSTITLSENVIFILLYRILDHLFSTVLCLPW